MTSSLLTAPLHKSDLITLLEQQALRPVFQPIVDTRQHRILGHESLIRGPLTHPLASPSALFTEAKQHGLLSELDLHCRQKAMQAYCQLQMSGLLFINVNPNLLLNQQHPKGCTQRMAQTLGIPANKIVIELSEQYPIVDPAGLKIAVEHYRQLGFLIAIDDLGTGYSGLKLWSEVKPDYVKIDRYFIQDVHQNPIKREFVQSIITLARSMQSQVIAEGIETASELEQLQQMGIYLGQGYYLGRPQAKPLLQAPSLTTNKPCTLTKRGQNTVATLAYTAITIDIETSIQQAFELLLANAQLESLPVLAQHNPVGIVRRAKVMELFSGSYGRSLYANKSVRHAMDVPVIVDWQTSLDTVSQLITLDGDNEPLSHFIVTQQDDYYGLASVRGLLRNITEQRLQHARYANPLTQLPGNVPIYEAIDDALHKQTDFYVAYFDLNHFKPYNDVYGYAQGDKVIQWVANLFQEVVAGADQFIGHVGGDDFVAIFDKHCHWRALCEQILARFTKGIAAFYQTEHQQNQGMMAYNRNGEQQFFPLLGLAIGVVAPDWCHCHSHHDVAALASDAKHQAKQFAHSHYLLSTERAPKHG